MLRACCSLIPCAVLSIFEVSAPIQHWIRADGLWWATSLTAHALILSIGMLIAGAVFSVPKSDAHVSRFEIAAIDTTVAQLDEFNSLETTVLPERIDLAVVNFESAVAVENASVPVDEPNLESPQGSPDRLSTMPTFVRLGREDIKELLMGGKGPGGGSREGTATGHAPASSFSSRRPGTRGLCVGPTGPSEQAVKRALHWLVRHQNPDGSWSLDDFSAHCKDASCTGPAQHKLDCAATALALLPFLGAGQTHTAKGPYQKTVRAGLYWLQQQQAPDGDLTGSQHMYSQGLATIVLCEAYGLTHDAAIGQAAVRAIQFVERAQHPQTGGWRYKPGDEGDTSVLGWQLMALKSAQMAGLPVSSQALAGAQRWLKSVGNGQGQFSYVPASGASPAMCAVGLLGTQYLGAPRQAPELSGGTAYLLAHLPDSGRRDLYYWYYATQVMHNMPGPEWDTWNRGMRKILVETQATSGCAAGSWDPARPTADVHGAAGGRLMMTSLGALTLEVYYRYLPLYQLDRRSAD